MTQLASKVFVCGVDAMDPRLTRKYIDMGLMPNAKKILERGAAREDLVMLGCMPTVTPPQWTTMATGCTPQVHGIINTKTAATLDFSGVAAFLVTN